MTVYTLVEYEGGTGIRDIFGVYSTMEKALAAKDRVECLTDVDPTLLDILVGDLDGAPSHSWDEAP